MNQGNLVVDQLIVISGNCCYLPPMSNNALNALFYPFDTGMLQAPSPQDSLLFLNAQYAPCLRMPGLNRITCQQYFKPYAQALTNAGVQIQQEIPSSDQTAYDYVFVLLPKNAAEAAYLVARGIRLLKDGGMIVCAGSKKSGGDRLKKMLQTFKFNTVQQEAKYKAKVVWACKGEIDQNALEDAETKGNAQKILNGEYVSQPGMFGWDKIDIGSEILLQHVIHNNAPDLCGDVADFGCGYGYLSRNILQAETNIRSLCAIDADFRAVQLCEKNLENFDHPARRSYLWADLRQPVPSVTNLDCIVMNPPFHEDKITDSDIGTDFIKTAYHSLKSGGVLWMVANRQLPYEETLSRLYSAVKTITQEQGFKVLRAIK